MRSSSKISSSSTGPLNIGNIVSATFVMYRSHFKQYLGITLRALIWSLVPFYGWAKGSMLAALISRLSYQELINQPETTSQGLNILKPKLWRFWIAGLKVFVLTLIACVSFVIVLSILLGIIGFIASISMGTAAIAMVTALTVISTFIFIVGFVAFASWLGGRFSIYELPIAIENTNSGAGIGRSWELTQQAAFRVQVIVFLAAIMTIPLSGVLSYPFSIAEAFAEEGSSLKVILNILSVVGIVIATILTIPFWQVLKSLIYYDLRSRKEGVDLKLRPRK